MDKWKVVLKRGSTNIVIDSFNTKKEAQIEIKNRYHLCLHLGYTPDLVYEIIKEPASSPKLINLL